MSLRTWIARMLGLRPTIDPARMAITRTEREVTERLARVSGRTPAQVRAEARRRAMQIERESYRR